jgi:TonB family protein
MMFTVLYYALFRKETFHRVNRIYLVSSLILSQILPAIKLQPIQIPSESGLTQFINAVSIYAGDSAKAENNFETLPPFAIFYSVIATMLVLYIIYQILRLFVLLKQNDSFKLNKYRIITLSGKSPSFSFFNLVFISSSDNKSDENSPVLQHELAHAKQWHSLDILMFQVIKIFQWFNPFIYLAEKALQETHEYLADEAVLEQNGDTGGYRLLLLSRVFGVQPAILSFFNYSLIKNRLSMMTKEKSPLNRRFKYLSILPVLILIGIFLSCAKNKEADDLFPPPPPPPPPIDNEKVNAGIDLNKITDEDSTYIFVDEQASFQDGTLENFREWVQKNIKYPEQAIKNGIYGKVIVQFTVNSKGKVDQIKILRGVDPLLDTETTRVISSSPDWEPASFKGVIVKQQFVIPVIFQLQ